MIPDLSELDLRILSLESRVFLSDELGVGFIVDDCAIVSPEHDCEVLVRA